MVNFKEDEQLKMLNHSCAHLMAQAIKHLYPQAKFWVGPVVAEGFYYDDGSDDVGYQCVYRERGNAAAELLGDHRRRSCRGTDEADEAAFEHNLQFLAYAAKQQDYHHEES